MSFDVGARQVALEDTILGHPRYKEALRQLEASATRARNVGLAGRARIMIGGAGDGKTRLLRKLAGQPWAQPTTGSTGDQVPMRYIEVPSRVNPRELVKTILESFGERAGTRQSAEDILDDLVPLFEGVGLRHPAFVIRRTSFTEMIVDERVLWGAFPLAPQARRPICYAVYGGRGEVFAGAERIEIAPGDVLVVRAQ